jgi:hypothetical protein
MWPAPNAGCRGAATDATAIGIHPANKSRRSTLALTDRERDVTVLVAQRPTNPEIVEYRHRNTYGKPGKSSRKELRAAAGTVGWADVPTS